MARLMPPNIGWIDQRRELEDVQTGDGRLLANYLCTTAVIH
jgi:hypothetical protein